MTSCFFRSAQDEGRAPRQYALIALVLLLLLLLLLGAFALLQPAPAERKGDGEGNTQGPIYIALTTPEKRRPTPTTTMSTTTRTPSTGYGYLVCTIGRGGHTAAMLPLKQELCDLILFTHVVATNGSLSSATGNVSYHTFLKAASQYKDDQHTQFGLSHSPHSLSMKLQTKESAASLASSFLKPAQKVFAEAGLSAVGVMGLVRKVEEFTHEPRLVAWFKEVASFAAKLPNVTGTLFLGLKLKDKGADLSSKPKLAKDVFRVVNKMEVKLFVLVTHSASETGESSCVSQPVSSWSSKVYENSSSPALEPMFKFLESGLIHETELEVALSSTLALMTFNMKQPVGSTGQFGKRCTRSAAMPFDATCLPNRPSPHEHASSITAYSVHGTMLSSFETAATVDKKMRRFVMDLDDKVYKRVGWAFFDLGFEVYNKSACQVKDAVAQDFPRLNAGKLVLEENRNREFP
ncbi:uncharacterized protein LOC144108648 [Amblyomma americanum]